MITKNESPDKGSLRLAWNAGLPFLNILGMRIVYKFRRIELGTVFFGGNTEFFFELASKIAGIVKAAVKADLSDRVIRFNEPGSGAGQSVIPQIINRRLINHIAKELKPFTFTGVGEMTDIQYCGAFR